MKELRRLSLHIVLLLIAAVAAFNYSRPEDEASRPLAPGEVELWGGGPEDVTRVSYQGKRKTVLLEQQKDDQGLWYLGSVEPAKDPPKEEEVPDGGRPKPKPKPVEPESFVSVAVAEKIIKKLAPMRASRAIGEVTADRAEAFGLHEPDGTLIVEIGGKKHELLVGASTPGTGDRYARWTKDNLVYVIDAAIIRDLQGGAGRLSERQQHGFKQADVERATILAGDAKLELIRSGTEGRRFWADPASPDTNAETTANWITKLGRLRPIKFRDALPEGATKVVRVELGDKKEGLGFLELYRHSGDKTEYLMVTEYLRRPATVAKTLGVQIQDDLATLTGAEPPDEEDGAGGAGPTAPKPSSAVPALSAGAKEPPPLDAPAVPPPHPPKGSP